MKKNFKLMLVALMALFGFNSAMAAELINSTQYTNNGYQYKIKTIDTAAKTGTVSVRSTNWTVGNEDVTKISIVNQIVLNIKGEISTVPFEGVVTFDVVEIEADAFKGLDEVTSIEFATPCKINAIGAGAFEGTSISNLDLTNTKIPTLNKLFEDANTKLTSVTLPATLTSVADYALEHCFALATINTEACVDLVTLGKNCFGDNVVQNLSLSTTKVADLSNNPFVGHTTGVKNKTLTTLTLPSTVTTLGTGLANLYNMTSVNLQATKIAEVGDLAFENDKSLTALILPATTKKITTTAADKAPFKGCASLATLTVNYDVLTTVGDGTNPLFLEATAGDGTLAALKTLTFTTANASTVDFAATIAAAAFANCTGITSVSIAAGDDINGATLSAGAIALSDVENSTVVFGNLKAAPAAGFIVGPTAATVATTVTIGEVIAAQAQTTAIISGNIATFTVGKLTAALQVEAIGLASKIVFGGEITTALTVAGTRVPNNRLTEIAFGAIKIAAASIPAKAFDEDNAPNLTTLSWNPAPADVTVAFDQAAFGKASVDAAAKITFTTIPEVAAKYPNNSDVLDDDLFNVLFSFTPVDPEPTAIKVYGPEGSNSFIGFLNIPATGNNLAIAKYQTTDDVEATITVYSAFVDEYDHKLYMDPLYIKNGVFVVEKGQTVVIRSNKSADVLAYETAEDNTMRYLKGAATITNDLKYTATAISADQLGTQYYDAGQSVYYMTNPASTGAIGFRLLGPTYYLPASSVYTVRNGLDGVRPAAANLEIVWLDNSEEATAILNVVKKNAANGAVYNLAGQKVDASYKGIVIKEGKKFIQK